MDRKVFSTAVLAAIAIVGLPIIVGFINTLIGYFNNVAVTYSFVGYFSLMKFLGILAVVLALAIIAMCVCALYGKCGKMSMWGALCCLIALIVIGIWARLAIPVDPATAASSNMYWSNDYSLYTTLRTFIINMLAYTGILSALVFMPMWCRSKQEEKPSTLKKEVA